MKTPLLPPDRLHSAGFDEVDRLLTDFYRAEVPQPWPRLRAPAPPPAPRPPIVRSRLVQRLARPLGLAAAVAFLLFGYLTLSATFSGNPGAIRPMFDSPHFGTLPRPKVEPVRIKTPRGNDARAWEKAEDGVIQIYLERDPQPAKQR
jgi:hypothetical protein